MKPSEARSVPLPVGERPPTTTSAGEGPPAPKTPDVSPLASLMAPSPSPLPVGERVAETDRRRHLERDTLPGFPSQEKIVRAA